MSAPASEPRVSLTIDGRRLAAAPGATLLAVARAAGIEIPTLCDHPDLEPVGACRLCLVEVGHPDWGDWRSLVTACLYPVAEGLVVRTGSEAVLAARRRVLSLLLARTPDAPVVRALAARHGATADRLAVGAGDDSCILCGLCVRVCETYATSAIVTVSRGSTKAVGSFAGRPPADCVGCGGCAAVCPTGNIAAARGSAGYEIWQRTFPVDVAVVAADRCLGCGACEEACPFHVARVALTADGGRTATIPAEACRGCGACLGACPSGAIDQPGRPWAELRERWLRRPDAAATAAGDGAGGGAAPAPRLAVLACGRSALSRAALPPGTDLIEAPCAGRASVPLLLAALAGGRDGVLVLGRHEATCRLDGGEDPARERARAAAELAGIAGLEPGRVRFVTPAPGPQGPAAAVREFAAAVAGRAGAPGTAGVGRGDDAGGGGLAREGLDATLALVARLREGADAARQGGATEGAAAGPGLAGWLAGNGLPAASGGGPALELGDLPALDAAARDLCRPVRLVELAQAALALLARLGLPEIGIRAGGNGLGRNLLTLSAADRDRLAATRQEALWLDDLLRVRGDELPRPPRGAAVACDGSAAQVALIEALGLRPVDVGTDPLPDRFALTPRDRAAAEARLGAADRAGAAALYCPDPRSLARWAMLTRQGTWRAGRVRPAAGVQLAWLSLAGLPLTPDVLAGGLDAALLREVASR